MFPVWEESGGRVRVRKGCVGGFPCLELWNSPHRGLQGRWAALQGWGEMGAPHCWGSGIYCGAEMLQEPFTTKMLLAEKLLFSFC